MSTKNIKLIQDLSTSLKSNFGVSFLSYRKIFNDESLYLFTLNNQWKDRSMNNQLLLSSSLLNKIKFNNSHHFQVHFWENRIREPLCQALYDLDIWNGVSIFKKHKDFTEIYAFSAGISEPEVINFYLQHPDILEKFIFLFKEKANSLVWDSTPQTKISEESKCRANMYKQQETSLKDSMAQFLKETQLDRYYIAWKGKNIFFLKNQKECLYYLSVGKTYNEIALLLGLSTRTIEAYARQIMNKLKCHTKDELIEIHSML